MAGNITVEQAMDAVFSEFGFPAIDLEGGEFTMTMYAEHHGIPMQSVGRHLQDAIKAGKLERRRVLHEGRRCWGYRLVV